MCVELYPHNEEAYKNIITQWGMSNKAAVVHPTGTGKSYIILKTIEDYHNINKVVLAPSTVIFDQLIEHNNYSELSKTRFISYQKLNNMNDKDISSLNADLIIIDEFHHCGADIWGRNIQKLVDLFPNAKLLGTSATHIRYLDGSRNMADELFDGNIVSHITLPQAIVRKLLKMPLYINALYTFDEEIDKLKTKVDESFNTDEEKDKLYKQIEFAKHHLENSVGVPEVLKKYINNFNKKFIVFCKNKKHLEEMQNQVIDWFLEAKPTNSIHSYTVFSEHQNADANFQLFKQDNSSSLRLLFCIDMLNEGLHLDDVSGVILLRPTTSPTVYYQQIGRCMSIGKNNVPIIFDLVNNFGSIKSVKLSNDLFDVIDEECLNEEENKKEKEIVKSHIIDETKEVLTLLKEIDGKLIDCWENVYRMLLEYKKQYGNCNVPISYDRLGKWCAMQRWLYNNGKLLDWRIKQLNKIEFDWDWSELEEQWYENYNKLKEYYEKNGHCNIIKRKNKLGNWVGTQRAAYKENKLSEKQITLLNEIEFIWDVFEEKWDACYELLLAFYNEHGHSVIPRSNKELGAWVHNLRHKLKTSPLDDKKMKQLSDVNFAFDACEEKWLIKYNELREYISVYGKIPNEAKYHTWISKQRYNELPQEKVDYKRINGHCNGTYGTSLGRWVMGQRKKYKDNKLTEEKKNLLDSIGFDYDPINSQWQIKYNELVKFYNENGHCNVSKRESELGAWIQNQKSRYNHKKNLSQNQIDLLNKINFDWGKTKKEINNEWKSKYDELKEYYKNNGIGKIINNDRLSRWVKIQRSLYKKGQLSQDKIDLLISIDFVFASEINYRSWEEHYDDLKKYYLKNGHSRTKQSDGAIWHWSNKVRKSYKEGTLSEEKIKLLEDIDFIFMFNYWMDGYEELIDYYRKNGHCNVPQGTCQLSNWVCVQREAYRKGKLSQENINKLLEIDFKFNPFDEQWDSKYKELCEYYIMNGHCRVPKRFGTLGTWVQNQRKAYHIKRISQDRIDLLNKINFDWSLQHNNIITK